MKVVCPKRDHAFSEICLDHEAGDALRKLDRWLKRSKKVLPP